VKRYVALEGVDGSGKSTVAAALARRLADRGFEVVAVREPGGTELGEEIRRLVLHSSDMAPWAEAALFAAQRAQLAAEVIEPALDRGAWVISDRSYFSSLAYQGGARGLGVDAVRSLNETVLHGVVPDLVVVLEIDPEVALRRQHDPDRIGSTGVDFQTRVAETFTGLVARDPSGVVVVSASRDLERVVEDVWTHLEVPDE
jgi:dTMP kinase